MKWHIRHPESTPLNPRSYCGGAADNTNYGKHPGYPALVDMSHVGKPGDLPLCTRCLTVLRKKS